MWFTGIWLFVLPLVSGHSWMSCPPYVLITSLVYHKSQTKTKVRIIKLFSLFSSFIATPGRGGVQNRHCETGVANGKFLMISFKYTSNIVSSRQAKYSLQIHWGL